MRYARIAPRLVARGFARLRDAVIRLVGQRIDAGKMLRVGEHRSPVLACGRDFHQPRVGLRSIAAELRDLVQHRLLSRSLAEFTMGVSEQRVRALRIMLVGIKCDQFQQGGLGGRPLLLLEQRLRLFHQRREVVRIPRDPILELRLARDVSGCGLCPVELRSGAVREAAGVCCKLGIEFLHRRKVRGERVVDRHTAREIPEQRRIFSIPHFFTSHSTTSDDS